jgi:hypothetical protein
MDAMQAFQAGANLIDNADNISFCTTPYQMSLVSAGTGLDEVFAESLNVSKILEDTLNGTQRSKGNWWFGVDGAFMSILDYCVRAFGRLGTFAVKVIGGASGTLASQAQSKMIFNALNFVTMGSLTKFGQILDYAQGVEYAVGLPSTGDAAGAWLANEIDECTFQAYAQANNQRWIPARAMARAAKFKFSALELMTLAKRDKIRRGDIASRLRELGSLEDEDGFELEQLFMQVPGPADLIRFMTRDVENQDIVDTFKLDTQFAENFAGKVKEWATQQGVSPDIMLREWRAHWGIPSPTQLYTILHRLRHDDQYAATHDVLGDVRKALIQQDILPYWIDALMAVSYQPLTRTDLNRAYERGWINDDDYLKGAYANGYSDDDARMLLKFVKNEQVLTIQDSHFGRDYRQGYLSASQLFDQAHNEGYDPSLDDRLQEVLDPLRDMDLQRRQVDAIVHRYKRCWITEDEAYQEAKDYVIPDSVIKWQLQWAGADSTCGTRKEMASQLCLALEQQIITPTQYVERMRKLRFDDIAINTYLQLCNNKIKAAAARRQLAQQKADQREAEKQVKDAERAAAKAARAAEKMARQLATVERSRQARNKVLETAVALINEYVTDIDGNGAVYSTGLYNFLQQEYGLSQNEAAHVISAVASRKVKRDMTSFTADAASVGEASLTQPWMLFPGFQPNGQSH